MARRSACGRPPGAVTPRPTRTPSRTISAPTEGLGAASPMPRRPKRSAAAIQRSSSPARPPCGGALIARERGFAAARSRPARRFGLGLQLADDRVEVARFAEIAVDRGEAHVGDVVEALEPLHHQFADALGGNVGVALALELPHDAVDHALDPLGRDGALAQRDFDRAQQLVAVERRAPAVLLDHHQLAQLHALEGGEAAAAIGTDAPPPDRRTRPRSAANPSPGCRVRRNRGTAWRRPPRNPSRVGEARQ